MKILVYRWNNDRCFIFDDDIDNDFTNNSVFCFNEDSLKLFPKTFEAAIKINTVLEYFYQGQKYQSQNLFYFHPSNPFGVSITGAQDEFTSFISSTHTYSGKLPDGGYLYIANYIPLPRFSKYPKFYPGTVDSVNND